jgi:hypothetical protein
LMVGETAPEEFSDRSPRRVHLESVGRPLSPDAGHIDLETGALVEERLTRLM